MTCSVRIWLARIKLPIRRGHGKWITVPPREPDPED